MQFNSMTEEQRKQKEDDDFAFLAEQASKRDGKIYRMTNAIGQYYIGCTNKHDLQARLAEHQRDFEMTFRGVSKKKCKGALLFQHVPVSIELLEAGRWKAEDMFRVEAGHIAPHRGDPLCLNVANPHSTPEEQAAMRRERENVKVTCEGCGAIVSKGNLSTHKKTKKHLAAAVEQIEA